MPTCTLCGEDNPPGQSICRRCKSTLFLDPVTPKPLEELPPPRERAPAPLADPLPGVSLDDLFPEPSSSAVPEIVDEPGAEASSSAEILDEPGAEAPSPDIPLPPLELGEGTLPESEPATTPSPTPSPPEADDALPGAASSTPMPPLVVIEERDSRPSGPTDLELDVGSLHGDIGARARAREAAASREASRRKERQRVRQLEPDELDPTLVVAPPPLPPFPEIPPLVDAHPAPAGLIGSFRYGLFAPRVAKEQRRVVAALGSHLARAKRHEAAALAALGLTARRHGVVPDAVVEHADTAGHEELRAREQGDRAAEKSAQRRRAEAELRAVSQHAEAKLMALQERHAPLASRLAEVRRRLGDSEALLLELRPREEELRGRAEAEPTAEELGGDIELEGERIVVKQRSLEEEVRRRRREHADALEELRSVEGSVESLAEQARALAGPIAGLERQMEHERAAVRQAEGQLLAASQGARAAEVSRERRRELASRSVAELDEEIGRALLREEIGTRAFSELIAEVGKSQARVAELERRLNEQQDQLDLFDRRRAERGIRVLLGSAAGLALALLVVGELLRRLLVALGD